MELNLEKIIEKLNKWKAYDPYKHPLETILKNTPSDSFLFKNELISGLEKVIINKNEGLLDNLISICLYDGVDETFVDVLCNLLSLDWHCCYEDIVLLLEKINNYDDKCVETLYQRALNVPDFDDARSLAKKCISLLKQIGTIVAIDRIKSLSKLEDSIISDYSISLLNN